MFTGFWEGPGFDPLEESILILVDLVLSLRDGEVPLGVLLGDSDFSACTSIKYPSWCVLFQLLASPFYNLPPLLHVEQGAEKLLAVFPGWLIGLEEGFH